MTRMFQLMALTFLVLVTTASPLMAQEASRPLITFSGAFGAGIVVFGAAYGIGRIGSSAFDGMARQPDIADKISGAMIVPAAMIEGAAVIGLIMCLLAGA